jgi:hypothetical protein
VQWRSHVNSVCIESALEKDAKIMDALSGLEKDKDSETARIRSCVSNAIKYTRTMEDN